MSGKKWFSTQGSIRGYASANRTATVRVFELIDNSIDHKAKRIVVNVFGSKGPTGGLAVEDDGDGHLILDDFLRFGEGSKRGADTTGEFGIGLKAAALDHGGVESSLEIRSVKNGQLLHKKVRWDTIPEDSFIPEPRLRNTRAKNGTTIKVHGCQRTSPSVVQLAREAERVYQPWLRSNPDHVIEFQKNGENKAEVRAVVPISNILMRVDASKVFGHKKKAALHVIALPAGVPNTNKGFNYGNADRFFETCSGNGSGSLGVARVQGDIILSGSGWKPHYTTLKDSLQDMKAVYNWVYDECADLLARAQEEAQNVELQSMSQLMSKMLHQVMTGTSGSEGGDRKPPKKRQPRKVIDIETRKRRPPKKRRRRNGSNDSESGGTRKRRPVDVPRDNIIRWNIGPTEPQVLHELTLSTSPPSIEITLNESHEHIKNNAQNLEMLAIHAIHAIAVRLCDDSGTRDKFLPVPDEGWLNSPRDVQSQVAAILMRDFELIRNQLEQAAAE